MLSPESPGVIDGVLDHAETAGKIAGATLAVVAFLALAARGVKRTGRAFVLWVCDVEVQKRNDEHRLVMEQLTRLETTLAPVAEGVDFITRQLIAKGIGGDRE